MEARRVWNPPSRPVVLLLDDHEDTLALYGIALSGMGFDVVVAREGDEALRRASAMPPDIIAAALPIRSGDASTFLRRLRRDVATRDLPVVAFTGCLRPSADEPTEAGEFLAFFENCLPDTLGEGLRQALAHAIRPQDVSGRVRRR